MKNIFISTSSFDLSNFDETDLNTLRGAGVSIRTNPVGRKLTEDEAIENLRDDVIGLIAGLEPLNSRVLDAAPRLKAIARVGIGLDTVDLAAAKARGIEVFNTPEPPAQAVAELTIGHIIGMLRNITRVDRAVRGGEWKGQFGQLLAGKTVGVIGHGRIGKKVSELLSVFGVDVIAHDQVTIDVPGIKFVDLQTLLTSSDIVTLHVPYTSENHHLIGGPEIASMKTGAYLVNVARGGLIDETALHTALTSNHLSGAALDCFETEPYSGPLMHLDNVVMTAHMGTYATETRGQMEREAARLLVGYLRQIGEF
jgi:D-3-phosphoglycerate dehydrogenase